METFKKTGIDTHYGPYCWTRVVPQRLPKGTPYYAQVIPDVKNGGWVLTSLECKN
jgi:hypothetical protein